MNRISFRRTSLALAAALASGAVASAQFPAYVICGGDAGDFFGQSVCGAGDVNGDGYGDFIAGAPRDSEAGFNAGSATVYSGLDGAVLHHFVGGANGDNFGTAVAGAGDVDNDGFDDVIAGAPFHGGGAGPIQGEITVFSGLTGAVLHYQEGNNAISFYGGAVDGAGDLDGDGYADFIVGASNDDGNGSDSGSVYVYAGIDGSLMYQYSGDSGDDQLGTSVAGLGDVNADGYDDFMAGAPFDDNNGSNSGSARVWSGVDGTLLHAFNGGGAEHNFGIAVAGVGDMNLDGHADFAAGAWRDSTGGTNAGSVTVYSGLDGSVLHRLDGSPGSYFGGSLAGAGDFDGDGVPDLVVGAPGEGGKGAAHVYSGVDASELGQVQAGPAGGDFGGSVGGGFDLNGDGLDEFLVGDRLDGNATGRVVVYSLVNLLGTPYCFGDGSASTCPCGNSGSAGEGCANSSGAGAALEGTGTASASADDLAFTAAALLPGQPALLFAGLNAVNNGDGVVFGDGLRCAGGSVVRLGVRQPDAGGQAIWGPGLGVQGGWSAGDTRRFQVWYRDPVGGPCGTGFNLTHGFEVTFTQ